MEKIIVGFILIFVSAYIIVLARDIWKHKTETKNEKGNFFLFGIFTCMVQFFSTFGISDFALSIPVYRGTKTVDDGILPGTLLTATAIPGALIAIIYITSVEVDMITLLICVVSQVLGVFTGVRFVARLNGKVIKRIMGICITVSTVIMLIKMIGFGASGGELYGLSIGTLIAIAPVFFILGALNMVGFGTKAPAMSLLLSLGLSPLAVLPVVLSCCTFGSINGGIQFVRFGKYQRKVALASSTIGLIGVIVGANFVKGLDTTVLQWIMLGIMVYTAYTMLKPEKN